MKMEDVRKSLEEDLVSVNSLSELNDLKVKYTLFIDGIINCFTLR